MAKSEQDTATREDLLRSNALLMAFTRVAGSLENRFDSTRLLETLGYELRELGLDCAVVAFSPGDENAVLKYVSLKPGMVRMMKKLTGISLLGYSIPRRLWPGTTVLERKTPAWYENPREVLRSLFPAISDALAGKLFDFAGVDRAGQVCFLPLIHGDSVIGAMAIWGKDLGLPDSPALSVFAEQVTGIMLGTQAHENETRRADDMARSNAMILSLSRVAGRLGSITDANAMFNFVGDELKAMGVDSVVGLLEDDNQFIVLKYASLGQDIRQWSERMTGRPLIGLRIPRRLWPAEKVVTERNPYWDPDLMAGTAGMIPGIPRGLARTALRMAGIDKDAPLCYLPLACEDDIVGVLAVWGTGLRQDDTAALTVFANQIAVAIRNSRLYEIEKARVAEKEILIKEIHHRVKNNLQVISSLLNLQAGKIEDPGTQKVLADSQSRVQAIAMIHEMLYRTTDFSKLEFGDYIRGLSSDLFHAARQGSGDIRLELDVEDVALDLDHAIPCGLILNELLTNALKHAFPGDRSGTISIGLSIKPGRILELTVGDDGVGIPRDFDVSKSDSLGLQLVDSLVSQIRGTVTATNGVGTSCTVSFKY